MEVEERLLSAIEQTARDGRPGEITLLAAFLACRGKVEMRQTGWQQPFRDYAERAGASFERDLQELVHRGIIIRSRHALTLNSDIIRYNKNAVTTRCANRLFARAYSTFAEVLKAIPYDDLNDLARKQSVTAENRAIRNMGNHYWQLRRSGLLVSSNRTNPYIFPTLRRLADVPWATAVAMTLQAGNALTWKNCLNECGMTFYMALATGCLASDGDQKVQITERGESLGHAYIAKSLQKRLRWPGNCREETWYLLLDELSQPLPAFWIDAPPSRLDKTWTLDAGAPLRLLYKDRTLRAMLRRLVRRLEKLGLAQLITGRDGIDRYFFAPNAAQVAKNAFDLPAERFELPSELGAQFTAGFQLLSQLTREQDGLWRVRPDPVEPVRSPLQELKRLRRASGPDSEGAYRVPDPDAYRWTVTELLFDPVTEFLTTLPEEEPDCAEGVTVQQA